MIQAREVGYGLSEDVRLLRNNAVSCGLPLICMLAYDEVAVWIDDSGKKSEQKAVCLAGFIGRVRAFEKLSKRWRRRETTLGMPPFHMVEIVNKQVAYYATKTNEWIHDRLLPGFAEIVTDELLAPVAAVVPCADFFCFIPDSRREHVGSEVALAFRGILRCVQEWADRNNHHHPIQFYIDRIDKAHREELGEYFVSWEQDAALKERYRLGELDFRDWRKYPQLRAADYLAHQTLRFILKERLGQGNFDDSHLRDVLSQFGRKGTHDVFLASDQIQRYLNGAWGAL